MIRRPRPAVVALGLAAAVLVVGAAAAPMAAAHVTVNPREAPQGGYTKVAFRVPNERPNAGTIRVEVTFPTNAGLRSVSVRPTPGWQFDVQRQGDQVRTVTWSGGRINPGEFQEFEVSMGPLPTDQDELVFPAVQTYDNGEVVRWIERRAEGGSEPDHPAAVLRLVAGAATAGGADDGHGEQGNGGTGATAGEGGQAGQAGQAGQGGQAGRDGRPGRDGVSEGGEDGRATAVAEAVARGDDGGGGTTRANVALGLAVLAALLAGVALAVARSSAQSSARR